MNYPLTELHNIMPIANIPSVMQNGILSNEVATQLVHHSVAMAEIQDRRDRVQVPGGLKLHQYANLYFHARNPMLFKRRAQAESLCVLRVSTAVLELPGVVLTDQNASSDYVRFLSVAQISLIDFELVFAEDWRHPDDQIAYWRHKSAKCAEVLVPRKIDPGLINGAYVASDSVATALQEQGFVKEIQIDPHLFFR
jgi:ssDNA thymidine ADP-ribosyltransferase DarT-like protein